MNTSKTVVNPLLPVIRWTARISSIIVISIFILMFVGEGFDPEKITPREWLSLFFFPFGLIAGMILAWWKEALGGLITLGSLFANFFVMDASSSGAGYMLLCASPGLLFLISWLLSHPAESSKT